VVVLYPETELASAAAEATLARAKEAGWTGVVKMNYSATTFDANKLAQQLKAEGTAAVFIFGPGNDVDGFLRAATALLRASARNPFAAMGTITAGSRDHPIRLPST